LIVAPALNPTINYCTSVLNSNSNPGNTVAQARKLNWDEVIRVSGFFDVGAPAPRFTANEYTRTVTTTRYIRYTAGKTFDLNGYRTTGCAVITQLALSVPPPALHSIYE